MKALFRVLLIPLVMFLTTACGGGGGGTTSYTISVKVTGLSTSGTNLILQNYNADDLTFTSSTTNDFSSAAAIGDSYDITISQQPGGSYCLISNASGTVNSNVLVLVTCSTVGYSWSAATVPGGTLSINALSNNGTTSYAAVGNANGSAIATILYTTSGTGTWNSVSGVNVFNSTNHINDVVYNGTIYVGVGNSGHVVRSTSGNLSSWDVYQIAGQTTTDFVAADVDASGNIVIVGGDKVCYTGTANPGTGDWVCQSFSGLSFNDMTHNSTATNKWVAVANAVSSVGKTAVSTASNGQSGWMAGPNIGATNLTNVSTAGSNYYVREVSTNNIFISSDGTSWGSAIASTLSGSASFVDIVVMDNILYAIDGLSDNIYISGDNGANWVARSTSLGFNIKDLLVSANELIAVGDAGNISVSQ